MELTTLAERCLERYRSGDLAESDLQELVAHAIRPRRQSLLYLQAASTNPHTRVIGISIFEDGADPEGVDASGNMLYTTVKQALDDGWRIIKFPELAAAMDEQNCYGLGYEFVLERWR